MNSIMKPEDYKGTEWTELAKQLTPRQIRNSVKRAYRREARKARDIAVGKLRTSGLAVRGNAADWEKGIREHIYSRGGGFLISVKARGANRQGRGEKGMHRNRAGKTKPVLMWAEEGTQTRKTKTRTRIFTRKRKGHGTGRMPAYGFLAAAAPEMYRSVETGLFPEVETAVAKVAEKAGLI